MLQVLASLAARLDAAGRDEARLKAELLLAHVMGLGRLDLYAESGLPLAPAQVAALDGLAARAADGEPIQYVLGRASFHGRWFRTDRRALIPRPETEELVQAVLDHTPLWCRARADLIDVGTGTGCIALTLAAERAAARVLALDISPDALALARENAAALGLGERVEFRPGDLLAGCAAASADAVVSNPPYVRRQDIEGLATEIRAHEPRLALDGGERGTEILDRLAQEAFVVLRAGGRLFLEIGQDQADAVRRRLVACGFVRVEARRDLGGHDRIVTGDRP